MPSLERHLAELRLALETERDQAITTIWEAIRAAYFDQALDEVERPALIERLREALTDLKAISAEELHDEASIKKAIQRITITLTSNF